MYCIQTKYLGPTDTKGSRIKATDGQGNSLTMPVNTAEDYGKNHDRVAQTFARRAGWHLNCRVMERASLFQGGHWIGYVYVARQDIDIVDVFPEHLFTLSH